MLYLWIFKQYCFECLGFVYFLFPLSGTLILPLDKEAKIPKKHVTAKIMNEICTLFVNKPDRAGLNCAFPICKSIIRVAIAILSAWPICRIVPSDEDATP